MRRIIHGGVIIPFLVLLAFATPMVVIFSSLFMPMSDTMEHIRSTVLSSYLFNTAGLLIGVGVLIFIMGVGTAWLVSLYHFPGRRFFSLALCLPLAFPTYVVAFIYGGIFEYAGPVQTYIRDVFGVSKGEYWFFEIRSLAGAIVVMSVVLYPYVFMLCRYAFSKSYHTILVSRTLGMTMFQTWKQVAIPLARPAIAAGITLALMEVIADFGAVQHFAVDTFTTGIYRTWFGLFDHIAAAQLSVFLLVCVCLIFALERISRGKARYHIHQYTHMHASQRILLSGAKACFAFVACMIPFLLGFALPLAQLLIWAAQTASDVINQDFLSVTLQSIWVALLASILTVMIALMFAYIVRTRKTGVVTGMICTASMGYAVPGSVVAVGILIAFGWLDNRMDHFFTQQFGYSTGLLLSGTMMALLFAYAFRFLAVALKTTESGLLKLRPEIDNAAKLLGFTSVKRLLKIHLPMISGSVIVAALFVFVEVLKELPATLIIRPFNFETLAVRTYNLVAEERLADSASSALMIVLVSTLSVVILSKVMWQSDKRL